MTLDPDRGAAMTKHKDDFPAGWWADEIEQVDREFALSRDADPLKAVGEACRAEFKAMRMRI